MIDGYYQILRALESAKVDIEKAYDDQIQETRARMTHTGFKDEFINRVLLKITHEQETVLAEIDKRIALLKETHES